MTLENINAANTGYKILKIADPNLSGKGFFGSRFKVIAPILGALVFGIASIFYFCSRSWFKKPSDDQSVKGSAKPVSIEPNIIDTKEVIKLRVCLTVEEEITEIAHTPLIEVVDETIKTAHRDETEVVKEGEANLSNPLPPNDLPPYPTLESFNSAPKDIPLSLENYALEHPDALVPAFFNSAPPDDLPPPLPPERKPLSIPVKRTTQVPETIEANLIDTRAITLKRTQSVYIDIKNLYKVIQNKKSIIKKSKTILLKTVSRSKILATEKKSEKKTALNGLKTEIKDLANLLIDLKKEGIDESQKEDRFVSRLEGSIKKINFIINDLNKTGFLKELTLSRKTQYEILQEKLKPSQVLNHQKNIESKLTHWGESISERNSFFNELESAELCLATDLGLYFNGKQGIKKKISIDHDFYVKYEIIWKASLKMAEKFKSIKAKETEREKMETLIEIFQSEVFNNYILAIKDYFPHASNQEILNLGVDLRALTLPTTRLPLYTLLIETAITLTPRNSPEEKALAAILKNTKAQLEFLI